MKAYGITAEVVGGELVLRMPLINVVRGEVMQSDERPEPPSFLIHLSNGLKAEVDRATYDLICDSVFRAPRKDA